MDRLCRLRSDACHRCRKKNGSSPRSGQEMRGGPARRERELPPASVCGPLPPQVPQNSFDQRSNAVARPSRQCAKGLRQPLLPLGRRRETGALIGKDSSPGLGQARVAKPDRRPFSAGLSATAAAGERSLSPHASQPSTTRGSAASSDTLHPLCPTHDGWITVAPPSQERSTGQTTGEPVAPRYEGERSPTPAVPHQRSRKGPVALRAA
jgi:hypothetical protein